MRRLFLLLFLTLPAYGTTWFVTPTGSDSNPCTMGSPCATPTHADSIASAGDTVNVAAGTYSYGASAATFGTGGTSGNPITITCATRGACKITNTITGNSTVVYLHAANLVFDGFEVTNTGAGNNLGVYVDQSNVSITRNTIHDIQTDCGSNGGGGIQIAVLNLTNIVIDSNQIYNISWVSGAPKCPSTTVQTDGILAEQTGFTTTTSITNNLVYNTSGGWGIGTSTNALIANNTIFNTVNGGVVVNNAPSGAIVENNIIVYTGLLAHDGSFYGGACGVQNGTSSTTTYGHNELSNNHGGNYGTGFGCSGSGLNTGDIAIDPAGGSVFVNWQQNGSGDYHEKLGSPTIGAGTTVANNHDFDGKTRPGAAGFDMGAYQATNIWHIRGDGGTATQCTGLVNAAYPGSGSAQPCALLTPYWLLNVSTGAWSLLGAGDTIEFDDTATQYFGQTLNGLGYSWPFCIGNEANCVMPPLPDNVKFTGLSAGSPTKILLLNDIFYGISVQGSTGVDIENLDISQPDTCTVIGEGHSTITNTAKAGTTATYNWTYNFGTPVTLGEPISVSGTTNGGGIFNVTRAIVTGGTNLGGNPSPGDTGTFTLTLASGTVASASDTGATEFGGLCRGRIDNYGQNGIILAYLTNQGPSNFTMAHVTIHGIAHNGIWGMHFNTSPSQTTNISHVLVAGSGLNNMDNDSGGCGTSCESQGTININDLTLSWSGAVEVEPNGGSIGGNGYNFAVDQQFNGAGDCAVMIANSGTWNWSNLHIDHCMQDGFDGLHIGDDTTSSPTVNVTNANVQFVEGQTFKLGARTYNAVNILGTGSCNWPFNVSFPSNPLGWNAMVGQTCRASDGMAFTFSDGYTANLGNITNITDQSTALDFAAVAGSDCTTGAHNCTLNVHNAVTMGFSNPFSAFLPGDIFIGTTFNPFTNGTLSHTQWFQTRTGVIPSQPNTVSATYGDPLFTAESSINTMNVVPAGGSPLIGAGTSYTGIPLTDLFGNTYSTPPPIGVAMASGTTVVATPTCSPVAGPYTSTQTVTCSTVTAGATICGTVDGTTPTSSPAGTCLNGTSGSFVLATTTTLKAIGTKSGDTDSAIFSGIYTINSVIRCQSA